MSNQYGPNTTIPTRAEAERDEHEQQQARGQCRPTAPCSACRRILAERHP